MTFIIYFGAAFPLLLAVGQLVKTWHRQNLFLVGMLLCIAYINFYIGLVVDKTVLTYPHFLHTITPTLYLFPTLSYMYLKMVTSIEFHWETKYTLHFIPFVLSLGIGLWYWPMSGEEKLKIFHLLYKGENNEHNIYPLIPAVFLIYGYIVWIFYENNPFTKLKNSNLWYIFVLLIIWLAGSITAAYSIFFNNYLYVYYTGIITTISIIYLFLLSQRYPDFIRTAIHALRKKRYERSVLNNVNLKKLDKKLQLLMKEEKIFQDELLSLKKVSTMLNLSSHQLSEYLNEKEKMNFNAFVNSYRVKEAKEMIQQYPERKILTIAYEVGFNSLSTFNAAFQTYAGITPSDYKKQVSK